MVNYIYHEWKFWSFENEEIKWEDLKHLGILFILPYLIWASISRMPVLKQMSIKNEY